MRARSLLLVLVAVIAVLGTIAVDSGSAASGRATVSIGATKLGRILVDQQGRTLYLFMKDQNGKSACAGACAVGWPPLLTNGKPKAGKGAEAKLLGTSVRKSGTQVTYAGHPLYLYAGDGKAGQTNGQGSTSFGAPWYVLAGNGRRIVKR